MSKLICYLYAGKLIPYEVAWQEQRRLVRERRTNPEEEDILMLLEHPPVYTLGTGAKLDFLKFELEQAPYPVYRVERGGEVTHHCPGQIVGYPILNLRRYRLDLHWYLRQLEEVIIRLLEGYGLQGERIDGLTGVWVEGYKVAALGIKVSQWITMHGFALNVCPDLGGFRAIVPCGISDLPVGSLHQFLPELTLEQVYADIPRVFSQVFQVEVEVFPKTFLKKALQIN
jgi:lipoyl(octanoyl) transferase